MVLYEINELTLNNIDTGTYSLELIFFKENLIHLLLINNTLNNQLSIYDNDLHLKYINFNGLNIFI